MWRYLIVLVGYSLGCVIIEYLIVVFDKKVRLVKFLDDSIEVVWINVVKVFLVSLVGCFFYVFLWRGLVLSEDFLNYVFGFLVYLNKLFVFLFLDFLELVLFLENFMIVMNESY